MRTLVIVNAGLSNPSTTKQVAESIAAATTRQVTAAGRGCRCTPLICGCWRPTWRPS